MATALHQSQSYEEAEKYYFKVLSLDNENYKAMYNLGHLYLDMLKFPESVECFQNACTINPHDADAFISLSIAYKFQSNLEGCLKACYSALQIDPNSESALYNLASTYQDMKCYHEAISIFEKVLRLNASHNDAWYSMGLAYEWLSSSGPIGRQNAYLAKARSCYENISSDFTCFDDVCERLRSMTEDSD